MVFEMVYCVLNLEIRCTESIATGLLGRNENVHGLSHNLLPSGKQDFGIPTQRAERLFKQICIFRSRVHPSHQKMYCAIQK